MPSQKIFNIQIVRFAIIGSLTALIYVVVYNLLRYSLAPIEISAIGAYLLAITFQYFGHSKFTFRKPDNNTALIIRFLILNAVGLLVATKGSIVLISWLGWSDITASIFVVLALPVMNWIVMRWWVFV